jgi:uncharacterized protein
MTKVAMPLDKLDVWLQGRTVAAATNLSMLDGFVTAVVAGPVSMDPPEWICPLLGIEIDAFNHSGTPEFAAISAAAVRHNAIVETLTNAPKTFEPIFVRKPGKDVDAGSWCEGFYAAMKLRLSAWAPLRNLADINHGLLLPILFHCVDDQGRPMLGPPRKEPETGLQGHSGRRRRNASVLDADTLQDRIVAAGRTWKLAPLTADSASRDQSRAMLSSMAFAFRRAWAARPSAMKIPAEAG